MILMSNSAMLLFCHSISRCRIAHSKTDGPNCVLERIASQLPRAFTGTFVKQPTLQFRTSTFQEIHCVLRLVSVYFTMLLVNQGLIVKHCVPKHF